MGKKYRKYKNFLEKYLDSNSGRRLFNVVYSVGASVVILGALFKLLHWPFGNQMLMIGMITEALVFLFSAFEKPSKQYKWEEVYPVLAEDDSFIPKVERVQASNQGSNQQAGQSTTQTASSSSAQRQTSKNIPAEANNVSTSNNNIISNSSNAEANTTNNAGTPLTGNITIVGGVGGGTPDTTATFNAISANAETMPQMAEQIEKFAKVAASLSKISDSLEMIIGNSDGIEGNTQNYVSQIEALNRNIAGLNTIYEVQLKGVSGQINTIEHINAGLDRIKKLYDGSLVDSSTFKSETEKMAKQLSELNKVYARMLEAMTTNMHMGGGGMNPPINNNNNP